MPPLPLGKSGARFGKAMNQLGWHWWPSDSTIATTDYEGRARCINLGHCTPGCAQGAKASRRQGRGAFSGGRSRHHRLQRRRHAAPDAELGIGEISRRHCQFQRAGWQEPDVSPLCPDLRLCRRTARRQSRPAFSLWSQEFYETDPRRDFVRGYTFQFGRGVGAIMEAIVSSAAGRLPWGEDHHRVYRKLLNHRISLSAICEDLPEEHNRVTLDPDLKDSSGIPAPKLDYTISANSLKMMEHGIARAKEVLGAAGASNIAVESPI
jgi:hypothetical protein